MIDREAAKAAHARLVGVARAIAIELAERGQLGERLYAPDHCGRDMQLARHASALLLDASIAASTVYTPSDEHEDLIDDPPGSVQVVP